MEVKKAVSKDGASASRGRRGGRGAGSGRGQNWGGPNNVWGGMCINLIYILIIQIRYWTKYILTILILGNSFGGGYGGGSSGGWAQGGPQGWNNVWGSQANHRGGWGNRGICMSIKTKQKIFLPI